MLAAARRHSETIIVAAVVAAAVAGGPSLAAAVFDAKNADKVDGKHAVGSSATVNGRKGRLVATNPRTGRLPNNIISKAPDANLFDGLDSSNYAPAGHDHDAAAITSGVLSDAVVPAAIARDVEVMPTVLGSDGPGSTLNADLLDHLDSSKLVKQDPADPVIAIHADYHQWSANGGTISGQNTLFERFVSSSTTTSATGIQFRLTPTIPGQLYGKNLNLVGVEFCFKADEGAVLSSFSAYAVHVAAGDGWADPIAIDHVERSGEDCRLYSPQYGPIKFDQDSQLGLNADVAWTTADRAFRFRRTTVYLTPVS